jgi:hypothetical protein
MRLSFPAILAVSLFFWQFSTSAEEPAAKVQLPNASAQKEAAKLIEEVYGEECSQASGIEEERDLAKKFLAKADEDKADFSTNYVLLSRARDIAEKINDLDLAFQAIDKLANIFVIDDCKMKEDSLHRLADKTGNIDHSAIARKSMTLLDNAMDSDRFAEAKRIGDLSLLEARKNGDNSLTKEVSMKVAKMEVFAKAYDAVAKSVEMLKKKPTDPDANLIVGKYRCFIKNDWDGGLPMLLLGTDDSLRTAAKFDLDGANAAKEQVKIGDAWWTLAERENNPLNQNIRERAGFWYRQALPELIGVAKDKINKRLSQLGSAGNEIRRLNFLNKSVVLYYSFDKNSTYKKNGDTYVRDLSGNSNDGLVQGAKWISTGAIGGAFEFGGTESILASDRGFPMGNAARTVAMWVKTETKFLGCCFFYGRVQSGDGCFLCMEALSTGRGKRITIGNHQHLSPVGNVIVGDCRWHHIALCFDGNNTTKLYVDGKMDIQCSRNYDTHLTGKTIIGNFGISRLPYSPSPGVIEMTNHGWSGDIDEFLVANRELSEAEIKKLFSLRQ